jgi:hypothetical protein
MCRKFPFIITGLFIIIFVDRKLGWVQPVGENPKDVTSDMTEVCGVGAFLLAGKEMLKLTETLHHD